MKGDLGGNVDGIGGDVIVTTGPTAEFFVDVDCLVLLQEYHAFMQEGSGEMSF